MYNYSSFHETFFKIAEENKLHCELDEIECFVLDNNGFIIISENYRNAGMFFGEVNDGLLQDMVRVGIYRKVHYYDYQAICIEVNNTSSSAMSFMSFNSPLGYFRQILTWLTSKLVSFYLNLVYESWLVSLEEAENIEYDSKNK